ncbi:hypothetical protein C8R47DRAFT_1245048 [Mycena vitilis]|nr:hypothetical protein C8R47DRAFT_1245048 [Mycena vitilis]
MDPDVERDGRAERAVIFSSLEMVHLTETGPTKPRAHAPRFVVAYNGHIISPTPSWLSNHPSAQSPTQPHLRGWGILVALPNFNAPTPPERLAFNKRQQHSHPVPPPPSIPAFGGPFTPRSSMDRVATLLGQEAVTASDFIITLLGTSPRRYQPAAMDSVISGGVGALKFGSYCGARTVLLMGYHDLSFGMTIRIQPVVPLLGFPNPASGQIRIRRSNMADTRGSDNPSLGTPYSWTHVENKRGDILWVPNNPPLDIPLPAAWYWLKSEHMPGLDPSLHNTETSLNRRRRRSSRSSTIAAALCLVYEINDIQPSAEVLGS